MMSAPEPKAGEALPSRWWGRLLWCRPVSRLPELAQERRTRWWEPGRRELLQEFPQDQPGAASR